MSFFEILIPITILGFATLIIKIISDTIIKSRIIKQGMVDENLKYLFTKNYSVHNITNLKWGFILIGIGLPFLLRQMFPGVFSEEGMIGLMFILAGVGFLIYYNIAKKATPQNDLQV